MALDYCRKRWRKSELFLTIDAWIIHLCTYIHPVNKIDKKEPDTDTDKYYTELLVPPPLPSQHFYAGCPSWHNPPNLSWLGTGTKYAGLHTRWLATDIIFLESTAIAVFAMQPDCNQWILLGMSAS